MADFAIGFIVGAVVAGVAVFIYHRWKLHDTVRRYGDFVSNELIPHYESKWKEAPRETVETKIEDFLKKNKRGS